MHVCVREGVGRRREREFAEHLLQSKAGFYSWGAGASGSCCKGVERCVYGWKAEGRKALRPSTERNGTLMCKCGRVSVCGEALQCGGGEVLGGCGDPPRQLCRRNL
jgi:hypothetical protein